MAASAEVEDRTSRGLRWSTTRIRQQALSAITRISDRRTTRVCRRLLGWNQEVEGDVVGSVAVGARGVEETAEGVDVGKERRRRADCGLSRRCFDHDGAEQQSLSSKQMLCVDYVGSEGCTVVASSQRICLRRVFLKWRVSSIMLTASATVLFLWLHSRSRSKVACRSPSQLRCSGIWDPHDSRTRTVRRGRGIRRSAPKPQTSRVSKYCCITSQIIRHRSFYSKVFVTRRCSLCRTCIVIYLMQMSISKTAFKRAFPCVSRACDDFGVGGRLHPTRSSLSELLPIGL